MNEPTVNVGREHVGHGHDSVLSQRGTVTLQRLLEKDAHLRPLHLVEGVDERHEQLEVPDTHTHTHTNENNIHIHTVTRMIVK